MKQQRFRLTPEDPHPNRTVPAVVCAGSSDQLRVAFDAEGRVRQHARVDRCQLLPGRDRVTGCTKVSPGCDHCYAETFAERWRGVPGHPYEQGFDLKLWPERLQLPFRWHKPRRVFVNSMSDLFHDGVASEFIQRVFAVMWRPRSTPNRC